MSLSLSGDQYVLAITSADQVIRMDNANRSTPPRLRVLGALVVNANYGTTVATDSQLLWISGLNACNNLGNTAIVGEGIVVPLTAATVLWQPEVVVANSNPVTFQANQVIKVRNQSGLTPTFNAIYLFLRAVNT